VFRVVLGREMQLGRVVEAARSSAVTYQDVGATAATMPSGYRHDRHTIDLRDGPDTFDRASEGLRQWRAHRSVGATVTPDDPPVTGATVIVTLRLGPVAVLAPCRIIDVIEEADRYGFVYGTLPGHPEEGEESFLVQRGPDGVSFRIAAFSRPAEMVAKLGGPVTRAVQRHTTKRYLEGLRAWVATPP